ncbi:hypothetical protein [Nocardioides sp. Root151]|uniref:hypothetical protein n=1 Tax=Nocardioides sp. Root151 TaxID=1736475 RepID=UPI0007025F04|nr:hypothetical protein [Nocardioides sp. Root151]KQZ69861.1 hypothetical protein ASD66_09140 [Nocardioides sp. Root151]
MTNEIEHLEQSLATPRSELLGRPDLDTIHALGRRRRTGRRLAVGLGGALAVAVLTAAVVNGMPGADQDRPADDQVANDAQADQLRPIAQRALDEIPGAVQVSPSQVVVPGPGTAPGPGEEQALGPERFVGDPITMGSHYYTGVTRYAADSFPDWLYRGVEEIEQGELAGEDGSYPVGSTEMGILVDGGSVELACMRAWDWNADKPVDGPCDPALIADDGAHRYYMWGMGTDDFLKPGSQLEMFSSDNYSTGSPTTLWVGGADGTDVARVEYVATDGTRTDAQVSSDALVPGETMFWADVTGTLAKVVTYDAAGKVIEDHPIRPCDSPTDCEVR